ncbi:MAG: hypothetical protein CSA81_11270 [Acidobacteria bacterium]|nr:MAG: hypothetical protein CSA81_11270 [Acidobacteriota bacterium]PIE89955.1 MAG: hypothetical protein CR997_08230 [Acidobacteriota bacterium]
MQSLSQILYWITTGMLIPVIVILLCLFIAALVTIGSFFGQFIQRMNLKTVLLKCSEKLQTTTKFDPDWIKDQKSGWSVIQSIELMSKLDWHPVRCEKVIADFEQNCIKKQELTRTMMRIGPMLGLMGTLIPMGPALLGLASGDFNSMASNMQVAFATTVVGIFIGAIGFIIQMVYQRWANEDINFLSYACELCQEGQEQ